MNKENPEKLREAVKEAEPALAYFLKALIAKNDQKTAEGKRTIVESYAELLSCAKNEIERAHWTKELSQTLGVDERMIRELVERVSQEEKRGTTFGEERPVKPFLPKTFARRSELLREAIIGLMFADAEVREKILGQTDEEVNTFLAEHPLFFFLQNGESDPMALIEEKSLKEEASRLIFHALEIPSLQDIEEHERHERMSEIGLEYWENLSHEIHEHDHMRMLAQKIEAAHKAGDKKLEMELLEEFAQETQKKLPTN